MSMKRKSKSSGDKEVVKCEICKIRPARSYCLTCSPKCSKEKRLKDKREEWSKNKKRFYK